MDGQYQLIRVAYGRVDPKNYPNHGYTYACDLPVKVGDVVLVPPTPSRNLPSEATVIGIGSDYTGRVAPVLGVVTT